MNHPWPPHRKKALGKLILLILFAVGLFLLFPITLSFIEAATRSIRVLWWLILLLALGGWLYWSASRKS
tara:strand:- start:770 stop:976 length:207 start_codon:yes stop_codon:yes gene_type:complete